MTKVCAWTQDDDGVWETGCHNRYEIIEGTPIENRMAFCCFCGKLLQEVVAIDSEDRP